MQDVSGGEKLVSPDSANSGGFDFLFDDLPPPTAIVSGVGAAGRPPEAPAPAAPMANGDAAPVTTGDFNDFLASFSPGVGHGGADGGMGGGQPLEDSDLFGNGFFFYEDT